ncbi:MAG TPA: hypothetical protein VIL99_18420 [Ignavibacteria bacterium]
MRNLNRYLLSLFVLTVLFSFSLNEKTYGQTVIVKLSPAPQGKLGIADLWNVSLTNISNETYEIYLFGTLTEKSDGLIATATTTSFDLKKGTRKIKASDFPATPDVTYPSGNPKYKESLIRTGSLPPGDYEYCVYARLKSNNNGIGSDCLEQILEDMRIISLMSPSDGEKIDPKIPLTFTWMSPPLPKNTYYTLKIVEVRAGQSPEMAFKLNTSWFEKTDIKTNSFSYPKVAKPFETGNKYAWGVSFGGITSEIFTLEISNIHDSTSFKKVYMLDKMGVPGTGCEGYGVCFTAGSEPWYNGGIKSYGYVKNNNLVIEYEEERPSNNGRVPIIFDLPLHPKFSKLFGYDRMVLRKGNYKIDYSKSKFGQLVIPVYEMSPSKQCEASVKDGVVLLMSGHCDDCGDNNCMCDVHGSMDPTPIGFKSIIAFFDDDYVIIEFANELKKKTEKYEINSDIKLNKDLCEKFNIPQKILKKGSYGIDYMNSKYGTIYVKTEALETEGCDLFEDNYDNPSLWTTVKQNSNIHNANGDILVQSSQCKFINAESACDIRVWRDMGITLPDTWQADFDYKFTGIGSTSPYVGHTIFALTAGNLNAINDTRPGYDMINEKSNQDAVSVVHIYDTQPPYQYQKGLRILVKKGIDADNSEFISINENTLYSIRLERVSNNKFVLSIFSNPDRLESHLIKRICFISQYNPTQLKFLQHSNAPQGNVQRRLTGVIDNTCINNRISNDDPCSDCDLFEDNYDNPSLWTTVKQNSNIHNASGDILVLSSQCKFINAESECDIRVWRDMEITLPDKWTADFEYEYTEIGTNDPFVGHPIFALTAGNLNPINDNRPEHNMLTETSDQDAVSVVHIYDIPTNPIGLRIQVKKGKNAENSEFISINKNTLYYIRLERRSNYYFVLSVFSDLSRSEGFLVGRVCFVSQYNPKNLAFLQHSNGPQGNINRMLTGFIDNTCITNGISDIDPCCHCGNFEDHIVHVTAANPSLNLDLTCGNTYSFDVNFPMTRTITLPDYTCNPANSCTPQYEYEIIGPNSGNSISRQPSKTFTLTANDPGLYILKGYVYCGGIYCDSCIVNVNLSETGNCDCSNPKQWAQPKVVNISDAGTGGIFYTMNCNDLFSYDGQSPINITFPDFICNPSKCEPQYYKWEIFFNNNNNPIDFSSQTNNLFVPFYYTAYGYYRVKFYAYCGDKFCDTIAISINLTAHPCNCGNDWASATPIKVTSNNGSITNYANGGTDYSFISSIDFSGFQCNPNTPSCQPYFTWEIKSRGNLITSGNGTHINIPNSFFYSGAYDVIVTPNCNGINCKQCILHHRIGTIYAQVSDGMKKASKFFPLAIEEDSIKIYDKNIFFALTNIKEIENYTIKDLYSGKDIAFTYIKLNDSTDGFYKIKIINEIAELIDFDGKTIETGEAKIAETKNTTNQRGIRVTLEQDPGGACRIAWPDSKDQKKLITITIPYSVMKIK